MMHCGIGKGETRCIVGYIFSLFNPTKHQIFDILLFGINFLERGRVIKCLRLQTCADKNWCIEAVSVTSEYPQDG